MTIRRKKSFALCACSLTLFLAGCASGPRQYAVVDETIRSILVVPSVNETPTVEADSLLSAMSTYPLAERG